MRQLPSGAMNLQGALSSFGTSLQWTVTTLLAVNLLLKFSLKEMFNTIEALQVIVLLPLLSVSMPANTGMFFDLLTKIAAFDLLPDLLKTNEFLSELLKLQPKEPISANFETSGFETVYFIHNLGSFAITLALQLLLVLLWLTCSLLQGVSKRLRKLREKVGGAIFWNSWITMINESFLTVGLCLMISFVYNHEFSPWGQSI